MARVTRAFLEAPDTMFLRAADALHLACATEYGFDTIYSNDRHLLAAATHFGITGVDVVRP
jgi:predicted nucleic acid-binding protein